MSDLLFQTDFISGRTDLPKVQNIEDIIYVETYEKDAYDHWLFGKDSSSLVGKVHGRQLTLQAGATVQPVYGANSVTLAAKNGSALLTDLVDTSAQNMTLSVVAKASVAANELAIIMGNLVPTSYTQSSGLGIFAIAEKGYVTVKPLTAAGTGGANSITPGNDIDQTDYFFLAASINKSAKTVIIYAERLGAGASNQTIWGSAYEASSNKIAIGNGFYSSTSTGTLNFAEAIAFDKALTLPDLQGVAKRSKPRMKNRGIIF